MSPDYADQQVQKELKAGTVLFVGLGLMSGSLAIAFKNKKIFEQVLGFDRDQGATQYALDNQLIDHQVHELSEIDFSLVDLVIIGTPVSDTIQLLPVLRSHIQGDTMLLDLGSTKRSVMQKAQELFSNSPAVFVGGHPMTGLDSSGIKHATEKLYDHKPFILVPMDDHVNSPAIEYLQQILKQVSARPIIMTKEEHDHMAAGLSHLPNLLAYHLVNAIESFHSDAQEVQFPLSLASGSFRDATRVARSNPELWEDIFLHNSDNLIKWWEHFKGQVDGFLGLYEQGAYTEEHAQKVKSFLFRAYCKRHDLDKGEN